MANIAEIKRRAEEEVDDSTEEYIDKIRKLLKKNPNGTDFRVPRYIAQKLESDCDKLDIPVHIVAEYDNQASLSIASTYTRLLCREQDR